MAIVPTQPLATTQPQPTRPLYQDASGATPDAFGAAQGGALAQGGRQVGQAADQISTTLLQEQKQDNARQAKLLDVQFANMIRTIGYGDGTADNPGFYSTKGENTLAAQGGARTSIEAARQKILGSIQNQDVREMFDVASQIRAGDEYGQIDRYVKQQRNVANDTAAETRINSATDDAATAWNNPNILHRSLVVIEGEVTDLGKRNGWAPDVTAQKLKDAQTLMISKVIASASQFSSAEGQKLLDSYRPMLDARMIPAMQQTIKQAQSAEYIQQEHMQSQQDRADNIAANTAESHYVDQIFSGQPVDVKAITTDPAFVRHPEKAILLAKMIEAGTGNDVSAAVSRATVADFMKRIYLPDGDPNKISEITPLVQAVADKRLNKADFSFLRTEVTNAQTPDGSRLGQTKVKFLDSVKSAIGKPNPISGALDPVGSQNLYNFQQYVDAKIAQYRKAGKDPYELFRPGSPEYLGSPSVLAPFQRTMEDSLNYMQQSLSRTGTTAPVVPVPAHSQPEPKDGAEGKSKSGRPMIYNGKTHQWEYK